MDNMDVFNAFSKSKSQILSYKRVTVVRILCFVNNLLLFTCALYWYTIHSTVAFVVDNSI